MSLAPGDNELAETVKALKFEVAGKGTDLAPSTMDAARLEAEGSPGRRPSKTAVIEALERFYRGILRARDGRAGRDDGKRVTTAR